MVEMTEWGLDISEYRIFKGWHDHFFGDALMNQYTAYSSGSGSGGALLDDVHGGIYRLTNGAGPGYCHFLWLGDNADTYITLDADMGWSMVVLMAISGVTNISALFGSSDVVANSYIFGGAATASVADNWGLFVRDSGGTPIDVDSGVVMDTYWHFHALDVYPENGGYRVNYKLDGDEIATTTSSEIPSVVLTPITRVYATNSIGRYMDLDFWGVMPDDCT